jgi:hypothetical protein
MFSFELEDSTGFSLALQVCMCVPRLSTRSSVRAGSPTAGAVVSSIMVKGHKHGLPHVDERHIGNVVVLSAAPSIYFADSVFALRLI